MIKKLLKWTVIAFASVFGLGLGRTTADHVNQGIPLSATWATQKVRVWITDLTTFAVGLVAAVLATKITGKVAFFGKGGGVTISK
jgi:hypothetical protein